MSKYKGFTTVKLSRPQRSLFDLSHENVLSTRMGKLTPIQIVEAMPNDTFRTDPEVLLRLAPMLAPIFQKINVFVHHFFVPNRLLWEDWPDFITAGRLGTDTPVPPFANADDINNDGPAMDPSSLHDYLGIPVELVAGIAQPIALMPYAAYYRVWYDYYRDRNFVADNDLLPLPSGELDVTTYAAIFETRFRAWQHDYFTSSLPFTQRGAEVLIPLSGAATQVFNSATGDPSPADSYLGTDPLIPGRLSTGDAFNPGSAVENAEIRLTNTDITINDLRQAARLQEWYERNAVAGSRYNESIMAHFGRRTSDARLQRAEYLGGGKTPVKISEVLTTAYSEDADTNNVPAGTMVGHGISYGAQNGISYNCEEHGFFISIMSIMPTSGYMQGLPRMFVQRETFLDYPWPSFANLGEQPVYDYEIYADDAAMTPVNGERPIFGYQSRYADWKHHLSHAHGDFRGNLDFWHLIRKFSEAPVLGNAFNTFDNEEQDRIFAVQDDSVDTCWCFIHNKTTVKRSLPYYGTPTL